MVEMIKGQVYASSCSLVLVYFGAHYTLYWTYVRSAKQADTDLIAEMQPGHGWKWETLQLRTLCIDVFLPRHMWTVLVCMVDFPPYLDLLFHGSGFVRACVRACMHDGAISLACQLSTVSNAVGTRLVEPVVQFLLHRSTTHLMAHGARVTSPEQDPTWHVTQLRSGCRCTASVYMW